MSQVAPEPEPVQIQVKGTGPDYTADTASLTAPGADALDPSASDSSVQADSPKGKFACPDIGTIWFVLTFLIVCVVAAAQNVGVLYVMIGYRSMIALGGYLIMQIGLWHAENKWDEEGSTAYIKAGGEAVLTAAGVDPKEPDPEGLEKVVFGDVTIPEDEMKAAFPVPWGFLVGW